MRRVASAPKAWSGEDRGDRLALDGGGLLVSEHCERVDDALIEAEARQQITDRLNRAAEHHLPSAPPRHRVAQRLRRFADRLDS